MALASQPEGWDAHALTGGQHGAWTLSRDLTLLLSPKVQWGSQAWSWEAFFHFCSVIIRFADKQGLLIKRLQHMLPRVITITVNQT